jgi:dolichyl-phosphate-mannose-protein mannosyltransferase
MLVVGYSTAKLLLGSRSILEKLSWGSVLGPGVCGLCMIGCSLAGKSPTRGEIGWITAIFAAIMMYAKPKNRGQTSAAAPPAQTAPIWWIVLCIAIIGYGIYVTAVDALVTPLIEWDAYSDWQLKAKVLALHALVPRPEFFSDVRLSFSHLRYPLLVPMIGAGLHAMTGKLDDGLEKVPYLMVYMGLGACVFFALRKWRGVGLALGATALLMSCPTMLEYAASGLADMALTAFYGCAIISILRWQESGDWRELALASLLGGCMCWTKNEGVAMALVNAIVILLFTPRPLKPRNLLAAAMSALVVFLIYLPFLLWARGLPYTDENYAQRLTLSGIIQNLPRFGHIVTAIASSQADWWLWGLLWFLPLLTAVLGWKRLFTRPVATLWALLLLQLLAYIPPYLVTDWGDLNLLLSVSMSRLLMHATPAVVMLVAMQSPDLNLHGIKLRAPGSRHPQSAYDPP